MVRQNWSTYSEFLKGSAYGAFPQEHRQSAGKLPCLMVQSQHNAHNFSDPALPESLIALPLHVGQGCTWEWSINGQYFRQQSRPGSMLIVPSNTESEWEINTDRTLLVLTIPNTTIKSLLGRACPEDYQNLFSPLTTQTWEEPLIEGMIRRLWANLATPSLVGNHLSDGLLTSVVSQLLIMSETKLAEQTKIALPNWKLSRVKAFIEIHLGSDINIDTLANIAGLSSRHFSRSFQEETGYTPHQWLMRVRIEKAKQLLVQTDTSILEISRVCGFSSQSHLTTAFKNSNDVTPLKWRHLNRN